MQAGISILAWFLLKLWGSGVYYSSLAYGLYRHGYETAYDEAQAIRNKWVHKKDRITEGLIEFHKAQCFFMLAIQAASLIAKHGTLLDRSDLQQIHNDSAFINVLSVGGHLPITFVLYTIRTTGHKSWYLLLLSTCTVALSAAALLTVGYSAPSIVSTGYQYTDCGDVNPTALCLETEFTIPTLKVFLHDLFGALDSSDLSHYNAPQRLGFGASVAPLTLSLIVLGVLLLDYCSFEFRLYRSPTSSNDRVPACMKRVYPALLRTLKQTTSLLFLKARYLCSGFPSLVVSITYVAFFFFYLIDLNYFQHPSDKLASDYVPLNLSQWTFGQIAAITIWIQPLFQYVYLEICGFMPLHIYSKKGKLTLF